MDFCDSRSDRKRLTGFLSGMRLTNDRTERGAAMHNLTLGICMGLEREVKVKGNELQEQTIWFRYVL